MANPMPADAKRFTYADLLTWPEGERWELIEGVAYDMTPAPSRRHQGILTELVRQFANYLANTPCKVYPPPFDVRLPKPSEDSLTTSTVVQPDLTVVCDREKLDERGCLGSPTLVVEILSPSTATKDMREKFRAYEQAGIPEYWIVASLEQTLMVFSLNERGRYGTPAMYGSADLVPVGVLPGLTIELARVFAE